MNDDHFLSESYPPILSITLDISKSTRVQDQKYDFDAWKGGSYDFSLLLEHLFLSRKLVLWDSKPQEHEEEKISPIYSATPIHFLFEDAQNC